MKLSLPFLKKIILLVCSIALSYLCTAAIRYVNINNLTPAAPYDSWANAANDLQEVINFCNSGDEIWVAAGTYKPNRRADAVTVITVTDRNNAYVLKSNIKIYGGFTGIETLLNQRNWLVNNTILSGDIGIIDDKSDNCFHVVVAAGALGSGQLDGFIVTKGNGTNTGSLTVNTSIVEFYRGGGIACVNSSPTVNNCIITDNFGRNGGGISIISASPTINNCSIINNTTQLFGGAIDHYVNSAVASEATINNCLIAGNRSYGAGGAIVNSAPSIITINNCTISGNYANGAGGAIYSSISGLPIDIVNNTIIYGNKAGAGNNNVHSGVCNATKSLFEDIQGLQGIGNIVSNANFTNPANATLAPTALGNYRLAKCSPAINFGNDALVPVGISTDLDINPRFSGTVDLGAYEHQGSTVLAAPSLSGIVYVNHTNAINGDGTTWATAVKELADALKAAKSNPAIQQIWVAKGIYKPKYDPSDGGTCMNANSRENAFVLVNNVKVYGGFAGTETLLNERNFINNTTILSGDIGVQDIHNDNSYHIIISAGPIGTATLNGFTLTKAYASGSNFVTVNAIQVDRNNGGAFYVAASSPTIKNCIFSNNYATNEGGGLFNKNGSSTQVDSCSFILNSITLNGGAAIYNETNTNANISNCSFSQNTAPVGRYGAAILNSSNSNSTIFKCTFTNNTAGYGGAIHNNSCSPVIDSCSFSGNMATTSGGAISVNAASSPSQVSRSTFTNNIASQNGGALYVNVGAVTIVSCKLSGNTATNGGSLYFNAISSSKMVNCLVSGNLATSNGGGLYCTSSFPVLINCTVAGNNATSNGGGLYFTSSPSVALVNNSIIYNNRTGSIISNFFTNTGSIPEVRNSIIENTVGFTNSAFNTTGVSPQFINPINAALAPTSLGNYSVSKCSPAINTGANTYIAGYLTDLSGNTRILNTTVDKGAYENNSTVSAVPSAAGIVFVDKTKSGDGSSWQNAVPELSEALLAARTNTAITQIWVAQGTYYPLYDIAFTCVPVDPRDKAFVMVNNVKIFGGFAGGETIVTQRNWAQHPTILSGDIGVEGSRTDNSYHVLVSAGAVGSAEVNGFIIQDGQATGTTGSIAINGINFFRNSCGGIYIISSSPEITNCVIKNNYSVALAAGIYVSISNAKFTNCTISGNTSIATGGGIYSSNPTVGSTAYARFYNCTVSGNRGSSGGGGYFTTNGTEPVKIYNSIFYGNKTNAGVANNDIISSSSTTDDPEVYYSIVGNAASATSYANMVGNSTANPLFISAEEALNAPTLAGNYRLQKCSPAINTGSNTYVLVTNTNDLDGNIRKGFTTVDKGAYEKTLATPFSNIIYVDSSNIENEGDGSSWERAITQLGDGLKAAKFNTDIQQIWVAKGTYKPIWRGDFTTNLITDCPNLTDRDNSFVLIPDVKVYGGFAGGETDTSGRDFLVNETILSADFSKDDVITGSGATLAFTNNVENAYHVVISAGAVGTAELDGFKITKGNANGASFTIIVNTYSIFKHRGGGMYNHLSSPLTVNNNFAANSADWGGGMCNDDFSSPTISNCSFAGNLSGLGGGGMANLTSCSPVIAHCSFINNRASSSGGGGINNQASSSPTIESCFFTDNSSHYGGGGVANLANSTTTIDNCNFTGNSSNFFGGGGVYNFSCFATIANCSFTGNTSNNSGGGIANSFISLNTTTVTNCSFTGNSASVGGGLSNYTSQTTIANCVFTGNTANVGGGMANQFSSISASPAIQSCNFIGNSAFTSGGGMANHTSFPTINSSSFTGNSAVSSGGAINNTSSAFPSISNSTIAGNIAGTNGGGIYNDATSIPVIKNGIVWGNKVGSAASNIDGTAATISYSLVEGGYVGSGNYDLDPVFISPEPASSAPTIAGDYHLQPCSPAINMGNNAAVSGSTDLDGNPRIFYTDVDLGAYEQQTNIYVDGKYTTWKGVDNDWHNKINWCGGIVPTNVIDVTIPTTSNNPALSAAGETKNIILNNSTAIEITNAGQLTINGTYTNSGSTITNKGLWQLAGNESSQSFPGTNGSITAMNKLEIKNSNGIQLDKSFEITGVLIPTEGNINVNDGVTITLNSEADSTASVAAIQPLASISYSGTGNFEIERFIKTPYKWQLLSAPTNDATQTVKAAWAEGQNAGENNTPGYGTNITGPNGAPNLDFTSPGYSLKYWDASLNKWQFVAQKDTAITNPSGYFLFVRGDRSVTAAGPFGTTTLRTRGKLFINPSVPVVANEFNSIGNPLASEIDLRNLQFTAGNISTATKFYLWDPTLPGSYNVGTYQTLTFNGVDFEITPGGSGSSVYPTSGSVVNTVQSGQAFYLKDATATAVTFPEDAKSTSNSASTITVSRTESENWQRIRINLFVINNNEPFLADGIAVNISDDFNNTFDKYDAEKINNTGENLSLFRDFKKLSVERHATIIAGDSFHLRIERLLQRNYFFTIDLKGMENSNLQPFLVDRMLQTETALNSLQSNQYNFTVTAAAASFAVDRFYVVFKTLDIVPVTFVSVNAIRTSSNKVKVDWKIENEINIQQYVVERSEDGINFSAIGTTPTTDNKTYLKIDEQPFAGYNYYRIKAIGNDGGISYSVIVKVLPIDKPGNIAVYPNPVTDNNFALQFTGMASGKYNLQLVGVDGKIVHQEIVTVSSSSFKQKLNIKTTIAPGYYILRAGKDEKNIMEIPVIVN